MLKRRHGLGFKLLVSLVSSLFLIFGMLIYINYLTHRSHLEDATIAAALRITDTLERSIHYSMLKNQCADVFELIETVGTLKGINKVRILNAKGKIEYSTDHSEIATYLNKEAESCNVCHIDNEKPSTDLAKANRWRIFTEGPGDRVLGLVTPIKNEPSCSNSNCHYHPPEVQILGVLDVNMGLKEIDAHMASDQAPIIGAYLVTMIIVAMISITFVVFMVHRPVKKLIEGTRLAAKGNLDSKLDVRTNDELGQLAKSFNNMTSDLKQARDEITKWAKTLEQRVEEKTDELNRAYQKMMRVEKMASLGKLSAIVAHEINNPLAGVLTYAKLLHKQMDRKVTDTETSKFDEIKKYISIIEEESARCGDIVKNLLLFAKKSTISPKPHDINELLKKSIMLVRHQMELESIDCITELDSNIPKVVCDSGQIRQMIVALLINATEAVGKNGEIIVRSKYTEGSHFFNIEISDDGVGMDRETQKRIFEPFYTTKEGANGSGLGLAVVYGIVQRHGGWIKVRSVPGKGATFMITLPYKMPVDKIEFEVPETYPPDRI